MAEPQHVHIAIAGSGFSGLGMAIQLKMSGEEDFLIFERAGELGGVWRDNEYPGCACDVESHLYSFSFEPNPRWTRSYSPQPEILEYLKRCADKYELNSRLRLNHEVLSATYEHDRWTIETSRGTYTADVLISGAGALADPIIPALPGLESFRGTTFHSARWDKAHSLQGKKVAVIGTGASAIQFVPAIQPQVGKLSLFQRTAPWIMARNDRPVSERMKALLARWPFVYLLLRIFLRSLRDLLAIPFMRPNLMKFAEKRARKHLHAQVDDPELRAKLTPDYMIGCKRILLSDDYYPALMRPNVEVVTSKIREVRAASIVTEDGVEHEVDTIIFGTGFRVTDPPIADRVRGRNGQTLAEVWRGSPKAHLGTTIAGFPNLFLLLGPNTGLGHSSVVLMIEAQIELILGALRFLRDEKVAAIEPRPEVQAAFLEEIDARLATTVWNTGGCSSWYLDSTGRNSTLWPGFTSAFRRRIQRFQPSEYSVQPLAKQQSAAAETGAGVLKPAASSDRLQ